jgi:hypothetical protein
MADRYLTVQVEGIKGLSGKWEIGPRTVLSGRMGAGKSGLLAALHLALLGKVPALGMGPGGTQTPALLRLICDDGATVRITMPDGQVIGRRVEYTPKAARVVALATVDGLTVEGEDAQEVIDRYAPDLLFADFDLFLRGTARERKETILRYFPGLEGPDGQRWMQCEAFAALATVVGGGEESPGSVRHGTDALRGYTTGAKAVCGGDHDVLSILLAEDRSMSDKLEELHEGAKAAERDRQAKVKAVEGIASIDRSQVQERAGELTSLQERAAELDREWARLEEQQRQAETAADRRAKAQARMVRHQDALAKAEAAILMSGLLTEIDKRLAAARGACIAHQATKPAASNRAAVYELDREIAALTRTCDRLTDQILGKRKMYDDAKAAQATHEALGDDCPTCGKPWEKAAEARTAAIDAAIKAQTSAHAEARGLKADLDAKREQAAALTAQRSALAAQDEERQVVLDAWRKESDRLDGVALAMQAQSDAHWRAVTAAADARDGLAQAKTDLAEIAEAAAVDPEYRAALDCQRTDLAAKVSAAQQAKAKLDLIAGAGLDEAQRESDIWRTAHRYATEGRNAFLQSRMAKTRGTVEAAVQGLDIGDKFVLDITGRDIEIGVERKGKLIALEALSKGQQVLFFAALVSSMPRTGEGFRLLTTEGIEAYSETQAFLGWLHGSDNDCVVVATQATGDFGPWSVVDFSGPR